MTWTLILTAIVIFITHVLGTITGFGSVVIAFPFITALLGIYEAKVLLAIVGYPISVYILAKNFRAVDWGQFARIGLGTLAGMPFGIYFFIRFPANILNLAMGLFLVVASLIQLRREFTGGARKREVSGLAYGALLFFGGIIHGAFGTSGPFMVLYAARYLPDKDRFRATLSLLWVVLTVVLFIMDYTFFPFFDRLYATVCGQRPIPADVGHLLWMTPFMLLGLIWGEVLIQRVNARVFRRFVFFVLLITGGTMVVGGIAG